MITSFKAITTLQRRFLRRLVNKWMSTDGNAVHLFGLFRFEFVKWANCLEFRNGHRMKNSNGRLYSGRALGTAKTYCDSALLVLSVVIALLVTIAGISPVAGYATGHHSQTTSSNSFYNDHYGFNVAKPMPFRVLDQALAPFDEPVLVAPLPPRHHTLPLSYVDSPMSTIDHHYTQLYKNDPSHAPLTGLGPHYLLGRANSSSVMRKPKFLPSTSTTTSTTSTTERTIYTFDISELALDDSSTTNEILLRHATPVATITDAYPFPTFFPDEFGYSNFSSSKNEPDRLYREFMARLGEMHALDLLVTLVGGALAVLTIFGNILVVVAFKIDKSLQTLSNYFLISLAFADFLIGCISMPLSLIYMLAHGWFLGPNVCDFWLSFDYLNSNSSVLNLLLISFDRYFSVLSPLAYRAIRSRGRIVLAIVVAWTLSSLLWPPWILAWSTIEGRRTVPDHMCYIPFLESNPWVTVVTAIAAFWLPVSIMIYLYFCIYIETERRYHDLNRLEKIAFNGHNPPQTKKFRIFRKKNSSSPTSFVQDATQYSSAPLNPMIGPTVGSGFLTSGVQQHLPNCPRTIRKLVPHTSDQRSLEPVQRHKSAMDFPIELSKGISASGYPVPKLANRSPLSHRVNIFSTHDYANETIQLEEIRLLNESQLQQRREEKNQRNSAHRNNSHLGQLGASFDSTARGQNDQQRCSWWNCLSWCRSSSSSDSLTSVPFDKSQCPGCIRRHRLRKVRQGVRFRAEQALQEKLAHEASKEIYTIVINLPPESPANCGDSQLQSTPATNGGGATACSHGSFNRPTVRMLSEPECSKPYKPKRARRVSARMPDISESDSDDSDLSPYVDSEDDDIATPVKNLNSENGRHGSFNQPHQSKRESRTVDNSDQPRALGSESGGVDEPRPCSLLCSLCCFCFHCNRHQSSTSTSTGAVSGVSHRDSSTSSSVITTTARAYLRANISIKSERKAAKMLSAILLAFIITWTPYNVIVIIKTFKPDMIDSEGFLWQISYYLCYINSTINPICYAMCNKNFRNTYMQILTCKFSSSRRAPILANATRGAGPSAVVAPVSRQLDERRQQQRFQ